MVGLSPIIVTLTRFNMLLLLAHLIILRQLDRMETSRLGQCNRAYIYTVFYFRREMLDSPLHVVPCTPQIGVYHSTPLSCVNNRPFYPADSPSTPLPAARDDSRLLSNPGSAQAGKCASHLSLYISFP